MVSEITSIESTEFSYPIEDVGTDQHGFNLVYEPGAVTERKFFGLKLHTNEEITGEYVGGNSPGAAQINMFANYLVGENLLGREKHWTVRTPSRRYMRATTQTGLTPSTTTAWSRYRTAPAWASTTTETTLKTTRPTASTSTSNSNPCPSGLEPPTFTKRLSRCPVTVDRGGCPPDCQCSGRCKTRR